MSIGREKCIATHQVVVRGIAGQSWGPWSELAPFLLLSARAVLVALREQLLAARTQAKAGGPYAYPLDETTFPPGGPGRPDEVLAVLQAALGTGLVLSSSADPVLSEAGDALELDGTMAVLGGLEPEAATAATFSVPTGTDLGAVVRVTPPAGWALADAWPVLLATPYDYLPATGPLLAVSSWAHAEADFFFPLGTGLHYQSTLSVQSSLLSIAGAGGGNDGVQRVRVGGHVAQTDNGRPQFSFDGEHPLDALSLARVGQAALALPAGAVSLRSTPEKEGTGNVNQPAITATVAFGGGAALACEVDVPTAGAPLRTLAVVDGALAEATLADALVVAGMDDVLPPRLAAADGGRHPLRAGGAGGPRR